MFGYPVKMTATEDLPGMTDFQHLTDLLEQSPILGGGVSPPDVLGLHEDAIRGFIAYVEKLATRFPEDGRMKLAVGCGLLVGYAHAKSQASSDV